MKPKRINKTKEEIKNGMQGIKTREQLLKDLKNSPDFIKKMKFTKEVFYPQLIKASKSVDDASTFLSSISTVMMQKFLEMMKEKKFSDLKLTESLDTKDEKHAELVELLDLFKDDSVFDARDKIEGMKREIDQFIHDEMQTRQLSDLKPKWLM